MIENKSSSVQPWYAEVLRCVQCQKVGLTVDSERVICNDCDAEWKVESGVPLLTEYAKSAQTNHKNIEGAVRDFYRTNPFPTYDDFDTVGSLIEKARHSVYMKLLDEQIPFNARVLECGCGTGQLSTFLSASNRYCLGVDMCLESLGCGRQFKQKQNLKKVDFVQGNIFNLPIAENSFDLVITKGVLHHTPDARAAFHEVVKRVKPGGYILLGLYNRYGRIPSWLRKQVFRLFGRNALGGDYVMKHFIQSDEKRRIWWEDQYNHPHETWHSVDEVLQWFDEEGIEYINAYPKITLSETDPAPQLFSPSRRGTRAEHLAKQLSWVFTIAREGALFDIIGRRRESPKACSFDN